MGKLIRTEEYHYGLKLYSLPDKHRLKEYHLKHERLCGDLYAAYNPDYWEAPAEPDRYGIKPDRIMVYEGKLVFWEVDRGTEDYFTPKGIQGKLDRYVELSRDNPDKRFHVIFTTIDNKQSAIARCQTILDMFIDYRRSDQFLVSTHEWVLKFPRLAPFLSPVSLMGVSIKDAK